MVEQLEAVGGFEAFDELRDSIQASGSLGLTVEHLGRRLGRAVEDLEGDRFEGLVRSVADSADVVALHRGEDVAEVVGVGAVAALGVFELQRFTGLLHEVHDLLGRRR
jgi:hypothetical protein